MLSREDHRSQPRHGPRKVAFHGPWSQPRTLSPSSEVRDESGQVLGVKRTRRRARAQTLLKDLSATVSWKSRMPAINVGFLSTAHASAFGAPLLFPARNWAPLIAARRKGAQGFPSVGEYTNVATAADQAATTPPP